MGENDAWAIVRWPHSGGGAAYCLGRSIVRPAPEPPVIVLSEVAGNPDFLGLTADFGGAATAAYRLLGSGLDPQTIVWFAHHGEFSSYDAAGAPETLTAVTVRFDGQRFGCELPDHRLLDPAEATSWLRTLQLEPVPVVLAGAAGPAPADPGDDPR